MDPVVGGGTFDGGVAFGDTESADDADVDAGLPERSGVRLDVSCSGEGEANPAAEDAGGGEAIGDTESADDADVDAELPVRSGVRHDVPCRGEGEAVPAAEDAGGPREFFDESEGERGAG